MRISYSSLNTYQTCPLKYKFQNIDRIKEPKSKEAVFGTILHAVMHFVYTPGILSPTLEQALDYFSKNWNSDVFESEIEERSAFSQGVEIIRKHYQQNDISKANIVALEKRFQIDLEGHIISGIIDRIDKTEDGYEVIDYKTAKKMPSQEDVDNNLQLSIYLQAFLNFYPKEIKNLDKIKVSLYFLKHGVKLDSTRTKKQLENISQIFLDVIKQIEEEKFEPKVTPLCGWCGYQDRCPMWKHKFKEQRKIDTEEINKAIAEYISVKDEMKSQKTQMAELQKKISGYMDQEGVERVFSEEGIIARILRQTFKYDEKKLREILEPLNKWEDVLKVNGTALKNIIGALPYETRKKVEKTKTLSRESKGFSVKKK